MKYFKPSISFEFFPPKTPEGVQHLIQTAKTLTMMNPDFFSVTFGAGGSTREGTIETVKLLHGKGNISVAPHLACIGTTRQYILDVLKAYQSLGIKRIVALRGDLPKDQMVSGDFTYACELVAFIRKELGDSLHIEVAAYPEVHPQAESPNEDVLNLKRKQDAGADSAITQYFYNPDAYFYFRDECIQQGVSLPIIPGIMPISQFTKLSQFSKACGAEIPQYLSKRLAAFGNDIDSMKAYGNEIVYQLCDKLISGGAPGLHFYTLNKAEQCIDILKRLNLPNLANVENYMKSNLKFVSNEV